MSAPAILDSRHHHSLGGDTRVCDDAVAGLNHVTTRFSPEVLTATGYPHPYVWREYQTQCLSSFSTKKIHGTPRFPMALAVFQSLGQVRMLCVHPCPTLFDVALPNVPRKECNPVSRRSLMRRFTYP